MPTDKRRAAARRRAWGRGPFILRFEPLEGRQLLSTANPKPDLVGATFDTLHNLDMGDSFHARGEVLNQGDAAVATPFRVGIYASNTPGLGTGSVLLGEATIPAGLQPGQKASFDQVVSLPAVGLGATPTSGTIYVATRVDPEGAVAQSNTGNDSGTGQGYDTSVVTITPHQPAALVGASLGAYPDQARWGGTVRVTAQVANNAPGDAPPTRARLVLTPAGSTPGGAADVTVDSVDVPAVAAYQTATVTRDVRLPASPPSGLAGSTSFTLSMVQDADFVTNQISPHAATRGIGYDMTPVVIAAATDLGAASGPKPDLTPIHVQAPTLPVGFSNNFQVSTTIQNQGKLDSGPFKVRFLLVGTNNDLSQALYLGDARIDGLKAGYSQDLVQTLRLPARLPDGISLNAGGVARIAVQIDPENHLDESSKANNTAVSGVVTFHVVGTDGLSTPVAVSTPAAAAAAKASSAAAKASTAAAARNGKVAKKPVAHHTLAHNLKVFPSRLGQYLKDRLSVSGSSGKR